MPECGTHSRPKLAKKARYNSLLKFSKQKQQQICFVAMLMGNKSSLYILCITAR